MSNRTESYYEKKALLALDRLLTGSPKTDNSHFNMDIWEWPQGVALYSMFKCYKDEKNPYKDQYLQHLFQWYERNQQQVVSKNINTVAPMLTMACLYEETGNPDYLASCQLWLDWIKHLLPKTEENGFQHITTHDENKQQLWDDTLFMTVLFVAKMAVILKDDALKEWVLYQFLLHIKYLHHPPSGLFYHGFTFEGRHHFGGILWARGNSWVTACLAELFEIMPPTGCLKQYFVATLQTQATKLQSLQAPSGLWHTVLDDPNSYEETSATACFAYGLLVAMRHGLLDKSFEPSAFHAINGVAGLISDDGTVEQVSYGTAMGANKEHYLQIPICPTAYGQGLAFLAMSEYLRYQRGV